MINKFDCSKMPLFWGLLVASSAAVIWLSVASHRPTAPDSAKHYGPAPAAFQAAPRTVFQPLPAAGQQPPAATGLPAVPAANQPLTNTASAVQEELSQAIAMVRPAVVAISTPKLTQPPPNNGGLSYIQPFTDAIQPVGSGLIVDRRGYVLTTIQTVGEAKKVHVTILSGGKKKYEADLVKLDPETDLALLKIRSNKSFTSAVIGNSDTIEVGDIVIAIGSPFGFSRSASMGIVSTNRRKVFVNGQLYPDLIQTDSAINQGDDGGPLINIKGEVVGINMAHYIPDKHFTGIGFAMPINNAGPLLAGP
ncbi:MAG: trypsin-like peptidase domain-containing protein [Desulfobulbaceae bacterium]|nr:trypsin-like peptidase domain-containing protein [Desulfobulbaceae bacterium]HIJ79396.1 trypsin-like serine protease [Deltaproteobacteria bacterium]